MDSLIDLMGSQPEYVAIGVALLLLVLVVLRFVVSMVFKVVIVVALLIALAGGALYSQSEDLAEGGSDIAVVLIDAIKNKFQDKK